VEIPKHTLWYLAPLPTFEEQKKEESRKWIDTAKLKMVRLYKSCDYGILLKLNFKATALLCRLFTSFEITAHICQHINKQKVKILWLIISIIFHSIRWFKLPDFLSKWPWWKLTLHLWNHHAVLLSAAVLYTNGTTTRKGNSDKQN